MFAAVAGLLASCGGEKGENTEAAQDSIVVSVPEVVYYGTTKTVPGDKNELEIKIMIAENDSVGTYEIIKSYTYGQTGQVVKTGQRGTAVSSLGTRNNKNATLLTLKKDGQDDKVSYYEVSFTGDSIIELASNQGRSSDWKDFIFTKQD